MTHLDELLALLPVPAGVTAPAATWEQADAALGITLPAGYKAFIDMWGPGNLGGELGVPDLRLPDFRSSWVGSSLACWPDDPLPLPMHPAEGPALFPLAGNGSGDSVYGIVTGGAVSEEVLWIGNVKEKLWIEEAGPFPAFLLRVVTGQAPDLVARFDVELWGLAPTYRPSPPARPR